MHVNLQRHSVFLSTFAFGFLAALACYRLAAVDRVLIGADLFFVLFLLVSWLRFRNAAAKDLRALGNMEDEGMPIIAAMALAAVGISIWAIVYTLVAQEQGFAARPFLAILSVPLGWVMIHTVMAFHYTALWYARRDDGRDAQGLGFPENPSEPNLGDFLYYSFTIGMTAQTSDVTLQTSNLRRVTLLHGGVSFFYNVVVLALAINAAVALAS